MNQVSAIGFGPDAEVFAGYAQSANERLGNIDFIVENTGSNTLYMTLGQYDGDTSPSGYAKVGTAFVVVPGGVQTKSYSLVSKRIGFFGSGNTETCRAPLPLPRPTSLRSSATSPTCVVRRSTSLQPVAVAGATTRVGTSSNSRRSGVRYPILALLALKLEPAPSAATRVCNPRTSNNHRPPSGGLFCSLRCELLS
jgi:hypothetical protein